MSKQKIILVGYSGHALVVNDCLSDEQEITGYFDLKENKLNPLGINYLGNENAIDFKKNNYSAALFPSVGSNSLRKSVCNLIDTNGLEETLIIHPSAIVSTSSLIGRSTLVGPGAIINAYAKIGRGVIINSGAIIEHETNVGDYTHIAPGATLAGNVQIGNEAFIGANAVCKQGIKIGNRTIIGAGSVVICDVPDNETWAGNPARKIKSND